MSSHTASTDAHADLEAVSSPLGVYPQFIGKEPSTLIIKERVFHLLSGDNFEVKDTNGATVVICQSKKLSFSGHQALLQHMQLLTAVISDAQGKELFCLRSNMLPLHQTLVAEDAQKKEVFKVTRHFGFSMKLDATFVNQSTQQPATLELRGDFSGSSADITWDGKAVAQITRSLGKGKEFLENKQTYNVTVAPSVDHALIAGICIAFDEVKSERNRGLMAGAIGGAS